MLELAAKRLNLSTPALRVFAEGGDEYDGDEDVVLIESDEIIYVSCGEDFGSTAPTGAPSAPPAAAAPAPTPPTAPQPAVLPQQAVSETSTPAVEPADSGSNPFAAFSLLQNGAQSWLDVR